MASLIAQVKNADWMMTSAKASDSGIELSFADGCVGLVPFTDIPEIGSLSNLDDLQLPNPFELVLRNRQGQTVELPWDFRTPLLRPVLSATSRSGRGCWAFISCRTGPPAS